MIKAMYVAQFINSKHLLISKVYSIIGGYVPDEILTGCAPGDNLKWYIKSRQTSTRFGKYMLEGAL